MALSNVMKGLIYNSVWSYQAQGTGYTETINKIANKFPEVQTTQDRLQVGAIIRAVRQSQQAGQEIEAGIRGAGDNAGIPIDWSGGLTTCKYQYRVLIHSTDTTTGNSYSTLVLLSSDTTLDRADIINGVQQSSVVQRNQQRYPSRTSYVSPVSATTYEVIGVGRCP